MSLEGRELLAEALRLGLAISEGDIALAAHPHTYAQIEEEIARASWAAARVEKKPEHIEFNVDDPVRFYGIPLFPELDVPIGILQFRIGRKEKK